MKKFLYVLVQLTWGFFGSLLGFFYMLKYRKCRHEWYHGAYVTYFTGWPGGISLGMFVFVGERTEEFKKFYIDERGKEFTEEVQESLLVHEYGHTIQSLILGPLYLFVVGIPSIIWCKCKKFVNYRKENNVKYCSFYCEKWANDLGRKVTGKEPIDN